MKKILLLTFMSCFFSLTTHAQNDSVQKEKATNLIERVTKEISQFKIDTAAVPNDKITKKIEELRKYRSKFNVDALVDFKLQQDKKNHKISEAEYEKVYNFFKKGDGKKWLDNAVIWVYRKHFTYKELKVLVRFYKSSAGQKWSAEFPIVLVQNVLAAEQVGKIYKKMNMKE
ncbi:MAG: DUF2059 domain-containing protein [Bacteroidales bacterium]|nr:DUF2059 domain-containing protein [Bacteroidales bacterium]